MKRLLPNFRIDYIPNIVLIGNGINRAFNKGSWDDLLSEIESEEFTLAKKKSLKKLPYPLVPIICTANNVDESLDYISGRLINLKVENDQAEIYRDLCELGYETILTTNYTYDIEKSINRGFNLKSKSGCKYRYNTCNDAPDNEKYLYKYIQMFDNPVIWHIHGEAALPKTMILGAYGYVNMSAAIRNCANRTLRRYKGCISHNADFTPHSWVDYFLLGNVDMIGFGLDISEIDLWWLIEYKKRHSFPGTITVYDVNKPLEWQMLANAYDVIYKPYEIGHNGYIGLYKQIVKDLERKI